MKEEIPDGSMLVCLMKKDLNTIICIFCDKVTKEDIYRHKQHLVGGYRNAKKCRKCQEYVREKMEEYMSSKKNKKEQNEYGKRRC